MESFSSSRKVLPLRSIDVKENPPVLVLGCKLGGLAIMRSLGSLGVPVSGVDADPKAPGFMSRYCRGRFAMRFDAMKANQYLEFILRIGRDLGEGTILIPTTDDLAVFVAENRDSLSDTFRFPNTDVDLVKGLVSKEGMHKLAVQHGVPTPSIYFPRHLGEVEHFSRDTKYPVMLKGIDGNRLQARTGKKMLVVRSQDELLQNYRLMEDPNQPNLMIQEYIPGDDDQIIIFNGYFNQNSDCLAAFTGHKIRQYPVHVGCASLGVCTWNEKVAKTTIDFMKVLGYRGILDIGYRWDPRDGLYKVLDINPRVGQAFRLFVSENGMDVIRALYRDLNGDEVGMIQPREGRKWIIEDYDIESSFDYYREGTLGFLDWLKSFKGLEEGAWFSWRDPIPFLMICRRLIRKAASWLLKRITIKQSQIRKTIG